MRYRLTFDHLESRLPLDGDTTVPDDAPAADISQPVPDDDAPLCGPADDSQPVIDKFTLPDDFPRVVIPGEWENGSGAGGDWGPPPPAGAVTTDDGSGAITGTVYPDGTFYPVDGGLPEAPGGLIVDAAGKPVGDPPDLPPPGAPELPLIGPRPAPDGGAIPPY